MDQAYAGAKPDQINRLSEDLTPMGSERAGNADGTIPAWTGGITEPPAGYSPGDHHPTPWPDDKPQFRITGANYEEYGDMLSRYLLHGCVHEPPQCIVPGTYL
jgi:hypothetical protein